MAVEVYDFPLVAVSYVASIASSSVTTTLPVAATQMFAQISAQVVYASTDVGYLIIVVVYLAIDVAYVTLYAVNVWHRHFKLRVSQRDVALAVYVLD